MSIAKVITAPFWISAFIATDVVIPIVRAVTGELWGLWRQKRASVHGDADWADDRTLKKRGHFQPGGIPLAATKKGKRIYAHPEESVLLVAKKGSGKSQTLIAIGKAIKDRPKKPVLVIVDPKGELHHALGRELSEQGYSVGKIDLFDPDAGAKYDPLSFPDPLDKYNFDRDVRALCELIVPDDVGSRQPHFAEFSRILFREVITAALKDGNGRTIADCVTDLTDDDRRDALIARLKAFGEPEAMSAITTFARMAGKPEGNSMLSTSLRKLETWRLSAIKEVASFGPTGDPLRPRGWTWDDVFECEQPVAMFLRTGLGTGAGEFVRLFCGNAVNTVRRRWNETGKALPNGLWLIVDEAQTLGFCNAMLDANNELRSAGVNTLMCFPSMSLITNCYGKDAENLMGQCAKIVFGGSDLEYCKYVSERLGPRTEFSRGESEQDGRKGESRHEIGVPLMRPDQLARLAYEECVVEMSGLNVRARKLFTRGRNGVSYL